MRKTLCIAVMMMMAAVPSFSASVSFIIGSVKIKSQAKWRDAEPGTKVLNGDAIMTGKRSMALLDLGGGSVVKLYPGTSFTYTEDGSTVLDLDKGTVFAKIAKVQGLNNFSIKHQTLVAAVRGTLFYFALHRKLIAADDLWICVNEGSINVKETVKNTSVTVKEGEGILVKGARDITPPKAYEWTKKLNWNMDPSKGTVIEQEALKGDDFPPVY